MSLLVKLGIGGVALAGLGTVAVLSTSALSEPTAKTLSEYNDEANKYADKLGGVSENRKLLVADSEENKEWWNWVYKNRLEPSKKTTNNSMRSKFSAAISGYGTEDTSLNKICADVYKKGEEDTDKNTDNPKLKDDAARFCVRGGSGTLTSPSK